MWPLLLQKKSWTVQYHSVASTIIIATRIIIVVLGDPRVYHACIITYVSVVMLCWLFLDRRTKKSKLICWNRGVGK